MKKGPSKLMRLVVYPLLALAFFVLAFYIILIAFGYTLHIKDGRIVAAKTGIIIIATEPGDASVYINNELYQRRTPSLPIFRDLKLNHLPPADYNIRIEKEGYIPWSGVVTVRPGYVSWLNYILLLPNEIKPEQFDLPGDISSVIASENRDIFLVTLVDVEQKVHTKWKINSGTKEKTKIFEDALTEGATLTPLLISFNNERYLYKEKIGEKESFRVRELQENGRSWDITNQFGIVFDSLVFSPYSHDEVFGIRGANLYKINFSQRTMSASLADGVIGIYPNGQEILIVKNTDDNYGLWRVRQDDRIENVIKAMPSSDKYKVTHLGAPNRYLIYVESEKELLYFTNGENNPTLVTLGREVVSYQVTQDKSRVLIKTGSLVRSYDFEDELYFDVVEKKDIGQAGWLVGDSNIVYVYGEEIRFVNFNGFYNNLLTKTNSKLFFSTSSSNNYIYFTKDAEENITDLYVISL